MVARNRGAELSGLRTGGMRILTTLKKMKKTESVTDIETLKANLPAMGLSSIARRVKIDWKNVYFGAKPYLDAMQTLNTVEDSYGVESGKSIVLYFLANAASWRGEVAKAVKAELKSRVK